jgi:hypothetical protein
MAAGYRFTVTKSDVVPDLLKALVTMAQRETDLLFGTARRKIETDVQTSNREPRCLIAGGTECGEHLARLLSGFLIKQVGEDGITVQRIDATPNKGGRHESRH